ncbi:hypothetical protein [Promicromonospora sp. NPDC023987]|uniref:hypothetical protein n=1 Tax=Promicromonospora sp. NPDC023987 TaxID=3155360 RepID=UPI0033E6E6C9
MATSSRIQAVERATGRGWDDWLAYLTGIGAPELTHHEIASAVLGELDGKIDNPGWWAQSTAVAYEQHIGRRVPGQRPDGTFQTSVSRSTTLGMDDLMRAWSEFAAGDADVVALIVGEVRVSGTEKRITWRAKGYEGESVIVISEPKKDGAASLVVQHLGSPTPERNDEVKEQWRAIVSRFVAGL